MPPAPTLHLRSADLRAGQTLAQDFFSPVGVLPLPAVQPANDDVIGRIRAFERQHGRASALAVPLPPEARP